jgi:glycosyltransferase 2 family protein
MQQSRLKFFALLAMGLMLGLLFAAIALRDVSWPELRHALLQAEWRWIGPFLAALFVFYWLKTLRWRQLLAPIVAVRTRELFAPVMIGYAGSALLPMQLGDLARTAIAARQLDRPVLAIFASIALERVFDLVGILCVLLAALALFHEQIPDVITTAGYVLAAAIAAAAVVIAAYVYFTAACVAAVRALTSRLSAALRDKILLQVSRGVEGFAAVRNPQVATGALLTTLLQWFMMWACVWMSLQAAQIALPMAAALVVLVLTVIGISLPSTPGYFGNIQLAYVLALKPFGIAPEAALAASLFFHAIAYPAVIIAGFALLPSAKVDWAFLRSSAKL